MTVDFRAEPIDEQAAAKLAGQGLELRLVDAADVPATSRYSRAEMRGFLGDEPSDVDLESERQELLNRRVCAVYDPAGAEPEVPVATVNSWIAPLTMPGGREVDAWAVSGVTVAPSHRRRGIQRQMMEAELRTAVRLGVPISALTVSESSIYGRYGYGCAVIAAAYRIDTRRASWTGPIPDGRLDLIDAQTFRALAPGLFERVRRRDPGQLRPFDRRWDQLCGFSTEEGDVSKKRRAVQYRDAAGEVRGAALYTVTENPADFTAHTTQVVFLVAETDDAYAALWRFFVEMDLVSTIGYDLGSVDEPLRWMVSDFRAVEVKPFDMHYLRVLDVAAVLQGRARDASDDLTVQVTDPLGFATGVWAIHGGAVTTWEGAPDLTLGVAALSALVLGGVAPATLAASGAITPHSDGALDRATRLLASTVTPRIDFWY
jgi:predicted acetyltransferase